MRPGFGWCGVSDADEYSNSSLYLDLTADSRDAMYRAMSYIQRCGGPSIVGSADDLLDLRVNRARHLDWLSGRQGVARIIGEYEEFRKRWSPVYTD